MSSLWITLKEALDVACFSSGVAPEKTVTDYLPTRARTSIIRSPKQQELEEQLIAQLQQGEIKSQAQAIYEHKLRSVTYHISTSGTAGGIIYKLPGEDEPFTYNFGSLPYGEHKLVLAGYNRTVVRTRNHATIFWLELDDSDDGPVVKSSGTLPSNIWRTAHVSFRNGMNSRVSWHDVTRCVAITASGITVSSEDVQKLWPPPIPTVPEMKPLKDRGGRPREWDWEGALIEMARINHHEGLPKIQARMVERMEAWFKKNQKGEKRGKSPKDTQLKRYVSRFYKEVEQTGR